MELNKEQLAILNGEKGGHGKETGFFIPEIEQVLRESALLRGLGNQLIVVIRNVQPGTDRFRDESAAAAELASDVDDDIAHGFGLFYLASQDRRIFSVLETPQFSQKVDGKDAGCDRRKAVGNRETVPDADFRVQCGREEVDAGYEEDQLPGQGQEDRLPDHPEALEEICRHHLESDDREDDVHAFQAPDGQVFEHGIRGEDGNGCSGGEFRNDETGRTDESSPHRRFDIDFPDPGILAGSEIVSCNRLHPLIESHDDHHEKETQPVDDAVSADGQVSAVFEKLVVDEEDDDAAGQIHQERPHADGKGVLGNFPVNLEKLFPGQVQEFFLVQEIPKGIRERHALAENGRQGGSLNAHSEDVDEYRVQDRV